MGETKMWIGMENVSGLISHRFSLIFIFICWGERLHCGILLFF
jgi:hypothetical protein